MLIGWMVEVLSASKDDMTEKFGMYLHFDKMLLQSGLLWDPERTG